MVPHSPTANRSVQRRLPKSRVSNAALRAAADVSRDHQRAIHERLGKQYAAIFEAHALLLEDPALVGQVETLIREQHFAAEYAMSRVIRQYVKALESLGRASAMRSRVSDLYDLERSVLAILLGEKRERLKELMQPVIVLAHDLTPSETAALDTKMVHAFATEAGGRASHTAIMAGALEIPAVVGIGEFVSDVSGGDWIIVDGNRGLLILDPDEETVARYESARSTFRSQETRLEELRDKPALTRDGVRVHILGNIEFPHEAAHCIDRGADGVGLYRTEFLYLGRDTDPTEEEHLEAYLTVLRTLPPGQPVVIRTLDLGADKFNTASEAIYKERNPFLGVRSVRLCLRNLDLFKTQLRAIRGPAPSGRCICCSLW